LKNPGIRKHYSRGGKHFQTTWRWRYWHDL